MASNDGLSFLGVVGVVTFGAVGAAVGAVAGVTAASFAGAAAVGTAVGAAVGATVGAAAGGVVGTRVVYSEVGVATLTAMKQIATKWVKKYKDETKNWINNHSRKGSILRRVFLRAHRWVDDFMVSVLLIGETEDGKQVLISEKNLTPEDAAAQELLNKDGSINHRPVEVLNSKDILKMKNSG